MQVTGNDQLGWLETLTATVARILGMILVMLMSAIVLDVTWQVFTRFILRDPSSFTEELAGFLLIWIGLLGASYALYTRAHLGIDILTARLEGVKKRAAEIIIAVVVLLFALFVLVIGGLRLVNLTFTLHQISPAMGIPMGYVYLVLPVTGILMIYFAITFIVRAILKEQAVPEEHAVSGIE
ncbi:MAG: TRAP transporter small permease [Fidelibacterota bacterium]|nr:MAG: TRAP transporter small permease [Candidatus Neomarinimicrobiota bacterium]